MKQPTLPAPRTLTASTHPQCTRKTPLLPTPPASARHFNYRNHYKQHIPGPSPPRYSINSTFSGPATFNNYRYYCSHIFQDHILQVHHTCTKDSSQDHSNTYQDISHHKYITYQFYYHTCYKITLHRTMKTENTGEI